MKRLRKAEVMRATWAISLALLVTSCADDRVAMPQQPVQRATHGMVPDLTADAPGYWEFAGAAPGISRLYVADERVFVFVNRTAWRSGGQLAVASDGPVPAGRSFCGENTAYVLDPKDGRSVAVVAGPQEAGRWVGATGERLLWRKDGDTPDLRCFSTATTSEIWRTTVGRADWEIVPAGDRVYVVRGRTRIECLSLDDGGQMWTWDAGAALIRVVPHAHYLSVLGEDAVYGLSTDTGQLRWRADIPGLRCSGGVVANLTLYVAGGVGSISRLDLVNGNLLGHVVNRLARTPWITGQSGDYIAWKSGDGHTISGKVVGVFSKTDGRKLWAHRYGGCWTDVSADGNGIYVTNDATIRCLDPSTGETIWLHDNYSQRIVFSVAADGRLFLRLENGLLRSHVLPPLSLGHGHRND